MDRVRIIIIVSGFIGFLQGTLRFLVPLALTTYGWDIYQYTTVFVFQAVAMSIPLIFGGISTDFKGRRITVFAGFTLFTLGSFLLAISINSTNIIPIIIGQVLTTISFGISQIGLSTMIVDETKEGFERTNSLGLQDSLRNFASFLGPVGMGFYIGRGNIDLINFLNLDDIIQRGFLILSILSLLLSFPTFLLPPTSTAILDLSRKMKMTDIQGDQRTMQFAFGIEEAILGFTSGLIVPFINFYILTEFKPDPFLWGIVFGLSNSTIAIGNFLMGRYSEFYGKGRSIVLLNVFAPFLALGIALAPSFAVAGLFYIIRSGFANAVQPAWTAWFFEHTPEALRGRSLSLIHVYRRFARAIGTSSGPMLFGVLGPYLFPLGCLFYPFAMAIPLKKENSLQKLEKPDKTMLNEI